MTRGRSQAHWSATHLEVVWLPHYHATANGLVGQRPARAEVLVDGYEGRASVCELAGARYCDPPPAPSFEPVVTRPEALEVVGRQLWKLSMLRSGWIRPLPRWDRVEVELIHYPFWVAYFENRRHRLYVRMLDAITGRLAGPSARVALLTALTRAKNNPSSPDKEIPHE